VTTMQLNPTRQRGKTKSPGSTKNTKSKGQPRQSSRPNPPDLTHWSPQRLVDTFVAAVKAAEEDDKTIWPRKKSKGRFVFIQQWHFPGGVYLVRAGNNHHIPPHLNTNELLNVLNAAVKTKLPGWAAFKTAS
jgi:hypothetical protein